MKRTDRQNYKQILKIGICMLIVLLVLPMSAQSSQIESDPVKVGFYDYAPYYSTNDQGNPSGYYHEVLELLANKLDFEYEYIPMNPPEMLEKLENGEIDLVFGAIFTKSRAEAYTYSKYPLHFETHSIYTNEFGAYNDIEVLEGKRIGYLSAETHNSIFANQMKTLGIHAELQPMNSVQESKQSFLNQEVDAAIVNHQNTDFADYPIIYNFSTGPVYLLAAPGNEALMNKIDTYMQSIEHDLFNPLEYIYTGFFNEGQRKQDFLLGSSLILGIVLIGVLGSFAKRDIKKLWLRHEIRKNLRQKRYCVYYQPIVNHTSQAVVSTEALLRLRVGEQVVGPYQFLDKIEQADMMYEVMLGVFAQVVEDYPKLQAASQQDEFYISINVSFAELTNPHFLRDVSTILDRTPLVPSNFCFEIVEREKLKQPQVVVDVLTDLQALGFKIAIDDFGTEYSNFDVLEILSYDILKVDKQLVDTITTSFVKQELIRLLTTLAEVKHKRIIIEGIETVEQVEFLQQFPSEHVFIQGYYYSRPIPASEFAEFAAQNQQQKK